MIIPKKHIDSLRDLAFIETKEYIELIADYEYDGYNIYARTPGSLSKSVLHQHTHLIKFIPGSKGSSSLYMKPLLLFKVRA